MRRVVVSGLGVVSPLGCGKAYVWEKLLNSASGISKLTDDGYSKLPSRVAGLVPRGKEKGQLDLEKHVRSADQRSMSLSMAYGLVAAQEALEDARWTPQADTDKFRTGVAVGLAMIDLQDVVSSQEALNKGYNRVSPYFAARILPNLAAGHISIRFGLQGPNHCVSTACATGTHAIGDAFQMIRRGAADVMVTGAAEACVSPLVVAAFCRSRALSTNFNDSPVQASRPFDKKRDGFVISEGAAILVLEELEHAKARGANMYAEVLGYGMSGDAHHMTACREDGRGALNCMKAALDDAGMQPSDVSYINAHATSTPLGDKAESGAIAQLLGDSVQRTPVSSFKGSVGHLLGAAGSFECAMTVLACHTGWIPPTLNVQEIDPAVGISIVQNTKQEWRAEHRIALKNSFGFGGTNASLCLKAI